MSFTEFCLYFQKNWMIPQVSFEVQQLSNLRVDSYPYSNQQIFELLIETWFEIFSLPLQFSTKHQEYFLLFQLLERVDPHYFSHREVEAQIHTLSWIEEQKREILSKSLIQFIHGIRKYQEISSTLDLSVTRYHEFWSEVFLHEYAWEKIDFLIQLGANLYGSWEAFRVWYRFSEGREPLVTENSPEQWNQLCQQSSLKDQRYIEFCLQIFGGQTQIHSLPEQCGIIPNCNSCAMKRSCKYYSLLPAMKIKEKSIGELLETVLEIPRIQLERKLKMNLLQEIDFDQLEQLSKTEKNDLPLFRKLIYLFEICRRYNEKSLSFGVIFRSSSDIYEHFRFQLRNEKQELFILVILNNKNQYIEDVVITKGILNKSLAHPREIFGKAIEYRAASIICVHNHPSGNPQASPEDVKVTKRLIEVGKIVGIPVLDHVIIGKDCYLSFIDEGLM